MKLSGVFASLPTPFDHRGEIYQAKITQNLGRWNRAELAGYLVAGSAGEGVLLTSEEKELVWELAAQEAKSGAILLAATGAPSVRETVELTKQAAGAGYHAAVIPPPAAGSWGLHLPQKACLYYRAIADQTDIPIVIENASTSDPRRLPAEAITTLAEHPNIIAVTDEFGEAQEDPLEGLPSDFGVLAGESPNPASLLIAGVSGMISGFAAAAPFFCLNLEEAVRTREYDAARDLEQRARPAIELLLMRYGVPGLKYALDLNGYYGGPARLPLPPLRPEAKQNIEAALDGIGS